MPEDKSTFIDNLKQWRALGRLSIILNQLDMRKTLNQHEPQWAEKFLQQVAATANRSESELLALTLFRHLRIMHLHDLGPFAWKANSAECWEADADQPNPFNDSQSK